MMWRAKNPRTGSCGLAVPLSSGTLPAAGSPPFALADDEMEIGVGIHGEPARARVKLAAAESVADQMLTAILHDRDNPTAGDILLLVNGFGGTPSIELYLM